MGEPTTVETEKAWRIRWQDRCYAVCLALDSALGRRVRTGGITTVDGMIEAVRLLEQQRDEARSQRDRLADAVMCYAGLRNNGWVVDMLKAERQMVQLAHDLRENR